MWSALCIFQISPVISNENDIAGTWFPQLSPWPFPQVIPSLSKTLQHSLKGIIPKGEEY